MGEGDGFRKETLVALAAVEQGLDVARARAGAGDVTLKGARDLVTATDVAVEDAIGRVLGETPGLPVVGEERGGKASGSYWLVDPICGTRNFASGIPLWCVNVALVEDGEVAVGVVGDPSTGELHVAERGQGAWAFRGDERRRLAATDDSQTIVIEDSHADPEPVRRERAAASVARAISAFRSEIHAAAGSLLAAEAGAVVTDVHGCPWRTRSDSILAAATPALHADLLALVQ